MQKTPFDTHIFKNLPTVEGGYTLPYSVASSLALHPPPPVEKSWLRHGVATKGEGFEEKRKKEMWRKQYGMLRRGGEGRKFEEDEDKRKNIRRKEHLERKLCQQLLVSNHSIMLSC